MNNKKAQIALMFVLSILTMIGMVELVVNISKLSIARLKLQKAVDAAALAIATMQARCFNAVADKNFILKYPSGDKQKYFKTRNEGYSFPGIHQVDYTKGFVFNTERELFGEGEPQKVGGYLNIITPHIELQDKFISVFTLLVSQIGTEYLVKNDDKAKIDAYKIAPFHFEREYVNLKYRNLAKTKETNKYKFQNHVSAWMVDKSRYMYAIVEAKKNLKIANQDFDFRAVALGEVVKTKGVVWGRNDAEDPKPEFLSRLAITQEEGVLH